MIDSEYGIDIYKSVRISIGTVMINSETFNTKKCVNI